MAATIATMAVLNAKCFTKASINNPSKPKPISLLSIHNLPKGLLTSKPSNLSIPLTGTAIAGAVFSTLSSCDSAFAAQQIAELAEGGDNRGLALLLPLIPALAWVLYNILQPALNQINKMRNQGVIIGLGLTGLAATGFFNTPEASAATDIATIAESASDNRGQLLLIVVTPALLWVAYNILQPALNQINKMRSD
ncbi:photosystem II reaction center proteins PsbY, chloroplastic [Solanum lycopersicum]|uniref:Photosystem II core complex proteins psbY, chloroplastic n=1 Tax=Solanum lycopersicum TaxID=4081 RepID=A0A3Q7IK57_SOLLC|nr:photosystem II core complex proteins psbY, chloroplastic [Solanum lycopersicum]